MVSHSHAEAEYLAMVNGACEGVSTRSVLKKLGITQTLGKTIFIWGNDLRQMQ